MSDIDIRFIDRTHGAIEVGDEVFYPASRVDKQRRWSIALITLSVMALAVVSFFWILSNNQVASDMEDLAYYRDTYLWKSGGTVMVENANSYRLRSLDSGKNWYAVERTDDDGVIILGTAEEVFPGLLAHIEGINALYDYVRQNGTITFSEERFEEDSAVLEGAGFTIIETEAAMEEES